ncbi:FtsX-like permease family protein [Bdellovibrionota bacterium FG-1]
MKRFLNLFSILLTAIALLSLVVGGIGINNMMLVSVTERIKEFGLRKALGATHRSIRVQVLMESVALCGVAGVAGALIGFGAAAGPRNPPLTLLVHCISYGRNSENFLRGEDFMKNVMILGVAVLGLSFMPQFSFAYGYGGTCSVGYSSDSYGRGVEAAFRGRSSRPRLADEFCYNLGYQWGRSQLTAAGDDMECRGDFSDGYAQGLEASSQSGGRTCYGPGYMAGRASLNIAAREGDSGVAGSNCVRLYRQGVEDFRNQIAATNPDGSAKEVSCYQLGYFEGPLAP